MHKRLSALIYGLVAAALALFDVFEIALLLSLVRERPYAAGALLLLLVVVIAAALLAATLTARKRRTLFSGLFFWAAANVMASVSIAMVPPPVFRMMNSGALASFLGLAGESAGSAGLCEVWWKIWLVWVLVYAMIARLICRARKQAQ